MKLEELQTELAAWFCERGVDALAAWPQERARAVAGPVVLVWLEKLECGPAGLQDYLGQWLDEESGQWKERYGRRAKLTVVLDVLAGAQAGAQGCRAAFDRAVRVLQTERPAGLRVLELETDEMKYDEEEGLMRLRCRMRCEGWLCADADEADTFLEFELRGDVNA